MAVADGAGHVTFTNTIDTETVTVSGVSADTNLDGGAANSVYGGTINIDGGNASTTY